MSDPELERLTDKEIIEMMIIGSTQQRITGKDATVREYSARIEPILRKCVDNMSKMDELTAKLIDANDNLAIERSSNKRMRALLVDIAGVLHGNPACYPPPLNAIVLRVHKEAGLA